MVDYHENQTFTYCSLPWKKPVFWRTPSPCMYDWWVKTLVRFRCQKPTGCFGKTSKYNSAKYNRVIPGYTHQVDTYLKGKSKPRNVGLEIPVLEYLVGYLIRLPVLRDHYFWNYVISFCIHLRYTQHQHKLKFFDIIYQTLVEK